MKYILSIILSFLAGCLVITSIYNYKGKIVIQKEVIIDETNTIKSSIDNVYNSVLTILGYTNSDSVSTVGSSFVYKTDNEYAYILTNYHVIKDLTKIRVQNNESKIVEAKIVGFDEYNDVAILKADKNIALQVSTLSDSSNIELGDTVFTVGSPLSEKYYGTVTKGIISYKNRLITIIVDEKEVLIDTIQTSTTINPGNSGGPLVNIKGEVVGIITSKVIENEIEGMGFAVPINEIKNIIDLLEKGETVPRLKTNFISVDLNDKYDLYKNELYLDMDYEYGIYIKTIYEDSKFKNILKENDIILKVNDINIKNTKYFEYLINKNDNIKLEIKRENEIKTIDFTQ